MSTHWAWTLQMIIYVICTMISSCTFKPPLGLVGRVACWRRSEPLTEATPAVPQQHPGRDIPWNFESTEWLLKRKLLILNQFFFFSVLSAIYFSQFLTYSRVASTSDSGLDKFLHLHILLNKLFLFSLMSLNKGIELRSTTSGAWWLFLFVFFLCETFFGNPFVRDPFAPSNLFSKLW